MTEPLSTIPPIPISAVKETLWPALPGPDASTLLAMMYQLEQSQWWSLPAIMERQRQQLDLLLKHTRLYNPFYRKKFKQHRFRANKPLDWETWHRLPVTTRDQIVDAGQTLLSTSVPKQHGKIIETKSAGSTGKPITVYGTELVNFFWQAFTLREHLWHNRDFSRKLAMIRFVEDDKAAPPLGLQLPSWGRPADAVFKTGPGAVFDIKSNIDAQAAWLLRVQPDYLLTYPTNAKALAEHFLRTGDQLHNLKEIRTLSETLSSDTRTLCRKTWGVAVKDMYSARETGYIALQCPLYEQYHVQSENLLVEILNADGTPCAPGEVGQVVVSTLHNYATPLIRYQIGDYAQVGEPCPCGRGLPVIKQVMGRVRNMLHYPDGTTQWPMLIYKEYKAVAPIRQLQMLQQTVNDIEVRVVAEAPWEPIHEERLKKAVQETLGHPFNITIVCMDEIPRSAGGKYEEFMSKIEPGT